MISSYLATLITDLVSSGTTGFLDASGKELSGEGYARQKVKWNIEGLKGTNLSQVTFPLARGRVGKAAAVGVFDADGNLLLTLPVPESFDYVKNMQPFMQPGALRFSIGEQK